MSKKTVPAKEPRLELLPEIYKAALEIYLSQEVQGYNAKPSVQEAAHEAVELYRAVIHKMIEEPEGE